MLRGLYTAGCGMMAQAARNDVIANNLANVNTTGFKKDNIAYRSFPEQLLYRINDQSDQGVMAAIANLNSDNTAADALRAMLAGAPPVVGTLNTGAVVDEVRTWQENGTFQFTGHKFDLALAGEGMFVLETPAGERYTRNGSFTLNPAGVLVNGEGFPVLAESGPVVLDPAFESEDMLEICETGEIFINGEYLDRLRVVTFADYTQLRKQGDSLFNLGEGELVPEDLPQPEIRVGFLEKSNVNPIQEMVSLIEAFRAYEANQKVVQAYDATLDKAVNEVGRA